MGRIEGKHRLNLGSGCVGVGIAIHELLHALGFLHEHNRPDRDDYVIVNKENIIEGKNIKKLKQSGIDSTTESPYHLSQNICSWEILILDYLC